MRPLGCIVLLSLNVFCLKDTFASCGKDAPFCPLQPLPSDLKADILALKQQSDEKIIGALENFSATEQGLSVFNGHAHTTTGTLLSEGQGSSKPHLRPQDPRLYIFVSLSMREAALIELGKDAKRVAGVLVLRGLKDGSFKKTAQAFEKFIQKTGYGIIIDPLLFKTFEVTTVPAFVVAEAATLCPSNTSCPGPAYDKLSGHVSLDYALSELARHGDFPLANVFLTRLRQ